MMNTIRLVAALALMGTSFVLAFTAVSRALARGKRIEARLAGGSSFDVEAAPAKEGLLERLGSQLSLPGPEDISRVRHELARAGWYDPSAVHVYYAVRFLLIVVPTLALVGAMGQLVAAWGPRNAFLFASALIVAGTLGPDRVVRMRQKRRTLQCREGFPDMMDLLVASIEAGLGMDAALVRVAQEIGGRYPALKVNLDLMNLELRAGRARVEAMATFAERTDMEEARALGVMLKQAEEMGSSLGRALRTFSEDMRMRRMMKAEEKAMALSAKLTVPLMIFIFPTIMIMLLLPAAIRLMEGMV